jgi:hypothetical protein
MPRFDQLIQVDHLKWENFCLRTTTPQGVLIPQPLTLVTRAQALFPDP